MQATNDKRSSARTPCNERISFRTQQQVKESQAGPLYTGTIVDISPTGAGLTTDAQLQKGQIVFFDPSQPNWELPAKGLVKWTCSYSDNIKVGIEFLL